MGIGSSMPRTPEARASALEEPQPRLGAQREHLPRSKQQTRPHRPTAAPTENTMENIEASLGKRSACRAPLPSESARGHASCSRLACSLTLADSQRNLTSGFSTAQHAARKLPKSSCSAPRPLHAPHCSLLQQCVKSDGWALSRQSRGVAYRQHRVFGCRDVRVNYLYL